MNQNEHNEAIQNIYIENKEVPSFVDYFGLMGMVKDIDDYTPMMEAWLMDFFSKKEIKKKNLPNILLVIGHTFIVLAISLLGAYMSYNFFGDFTFLAYFLVTTPMVGIVYFLTYRVEA